MYESSFIGKGPNVISRFTTNTLLNNATLVWMNKGKLATWLSIREARSFYTMGGGRDWWRLPKGTQIRENSEDLTFDQKDKKAVSLWQSWQRGTPYSLPTTVLYRR